MSARPCVHLSQLLSRGMLVCGLLVQKNMMLHACVWCPARVMRQTRSFYTTLQGTHEQLHFLHTLSAPSVPYVQGSDAPL